MKSCGGRDHTEKKTKRTGYCSFAEVDDDSAQRWMIACWSFTEYGDEAYRLWWGVPCALMESSGVGIAGRPSNSLQMRGGPFLGQTPLGAPVSGGLCTYNKQADMSNQVSPLDRGFGNGKTLNPTKVINWAGGLGEMSEPGRRPQRTSCMVMCAQCV